MKNLKKISLVFAFFAGLTSGVFASPLKDKETKIPYITAKRYFVNNTVPDGIFLHPKITSQEAFEKLFGMATVMGKDGTPTPIDFSNQYAIAVINHTTNAHVSMAAKSLIEKNGIITFTYSKTETPSQSLTQYRHCLIVVVDNKYKGEVKIVTDQNEENLSFVTARNYFVKNTVIDGQFLLPKIKIQEEFERFFGMAALMGEGGLPTEIDFSKQYVIAVVAAESSKHSCPIAKSLTKKDGVLTLTYQQTEAKEVSSAIYRYCLIVIVDNKDSGEVKFVKVD